MPPNRRRGLLRINSEIQQQGNVDRSGMSSGLNTAARSFASIGKQVGAIADHAARKEGAAAGRQAGLDPEFRPTRSLTIRGEAYDKAGLDVYRVRAKQRFEADLQEAFDQHASDPVVLDEALKAKRDAWVNSAPQEVRPELELQYQRTHLTFMREAARAQAARFNAEHKETIKDGLAEALRDFDQKQYALGLDDRSSDVAATYQAEFEELLSATGVDGSPLFSPKEREKVLDSLPQRAGRMRLMGAFDRASLSEKDAMLEKWREDFANSEGLASRYNFEQFESITRDLEARRSKAERAHNSEVRAAEEALKAQTDAAERGLPVREELQQEIEARVVAADDPELTAAYERAKQTLEFQDWARTLTPAQLSGAIDAERKRMEAEGATPEDLARLDMGKKLLSNMRSMLTKDPLRWAPRAGYEVPELDLSSRETTVASLQARAAVARQFRNDFGLDSTPWLKSDEKLPVAEIIAQGGEEALQRLDWIVEGLGHDGAIEMMAQVSDEAPQTAYLGALVSRVGPAQVARDAMRTLERKSILGDDYQGRAPSKTEILPVVTSELGAALSEFPGSADAAIGVAISAYEQRARRRSLDKFDEDLFRKTLREVFGERQIGGETYGGIVESDASYWHEHKIILPTFVRQDGWREVIDMLTLPDLAAAELGNPVGVEGETIGLDRLKNGTLIQVGDGQYAIAMGDPSSPQTANLVGRDRRESVHRPRGRR